MTKLRGKRTRGKKIFPASLEPYSYPAGRICKYPTCKTIITIYSSSRFCHVHKFIATDIRLSLMNDLIMARDRLYSAKSIFHKRYYKKKVKTIKEAMAQCR